MLVYACEHSSEGILDSIKFQSNRKESRDFHTFTLKKYCSFMQIEFFMEMGIGFMY